MARIKDTIIEQQDTGKDVYGKKSPIVIKYKKEVEQILNHNNRALRPLDGSTPWDKNPLE